MDENYISYTLNGGRQGTAVHPYLRVAVSRITRYGNLGLFRLTVLSFSSGDALVISQAGRNCYSTVPQLLGCLTEISFRAHSDTAHSYHAFGGECPKCRAFPCDRKTQKTGRSSLLPCPSHASWKVSFSSARRHVQVVKNSLETVVRFMTTRASIATGISRRN